MRAAARSPSDGYTYVFSSAYTIVILPSLLKEAGFNLNRDFTPPTAIVQRVNASVNKGLSMPDIGAKLKDLGMYPMPGTTQNFIDSIAEERRRWEKVIKAAHIEPQ